MSYTFNEGPQIGISLPTLRGWIGWQLDKWEAWAQQQPDARWMEIPTGNENWPTAGRLFIHAFGPVRRYAERILGTEPFNDRELQVAEFSELAAFARECLAISANAAAEFEVQQARTESSFRTRSGSEWVITSEEAFVHSLTHCFWHLGGISQLLRANGIAPPQWSDLIVYATELRKQEQTKSSNA